MKTDKTFTNGLLETRPGGPFLAGTRISVYCIYHYWIQGDSDPTALAQLMKVRPEQIVAAFEYIKDHQDDVETVHRQIEEEIARGNPPEVEKRLARVRAEFQAKLARRRPRKQPEAAHAQDSGR